MSKLWLPLLLVLVRERGSSAFRAAGRASTPATALRSQTGDDDLRAMVESLSARVSDLEDELAAYRNHRRELAEKELAVLCALPCLHIFERKSMECRDRESTAGRASSVPSSTNFRSTLGARAFAASQPFP